MFPQQASERRCACRGARPEPVERVSRPLRSTICDRRLLIPETPAPGLPLEKSVVRGPWSEAHVKVQGGRTRCTDRRPVRRSLGKDESLITDHSVRGGFTLLELLIVIGIIAVLLVLLAPAFTTIKGGGDVTSAAYTIKGVLDTARTYAKANNTYTWAGFAGSIGSSVTGNVAVSIVASKDGSDLGTSANIVGPRVDITSGVTSVGKVIRLDNAHIGDTGTPTNDGTDFESRANVNINYRLGAAGSTYNSDYYFIEQGTQFDRWIRFSPRGESVVKGGTTQISQYAEVGLLPTHGTSLAAAINPASGNLAAIQISGFGGNVRIYRR
jgi:prepilin-type N-terminal cleavage/methylation domain-containing protein